MGDLYNKQELFQQKRVRDDIHQRNVDFLMLYEEICDFMRDQEHEWFPHECTQSNWNDRTTQDIFKDDLEQLCHFIESISQHFELPIQTHEINFEEWDSMPTLAHELTKRYKEAAKKKQ